MSSSSNVGIVFTLIASCFYGFYPVYYKQLPDVPSFQLVCHRVVWSFLTLIPFLLWQVKWETFRATVFKPKALGIYLASGVCIVGFWCFLLWGIANDYIVEVSLGGFINPVFSVLLAVVVFKEKLRLLQWASVVFALVGVLAIAIAYGRFPWLAICIGALLSFYGLFKRIAPLGPVEGVFIEMAWFTIPAIVAIIVFQVHGNGAFGHVGATQDALLVVSGIVTIVPLMMLSRGAQLISFTLFGVIQYITPILNFLVGTVIYHEPFSTSKMIGFILVWVALIVYTVEGIIVQKRNAAAATTSSLEEKEEKEESHDTDSVPQSPSSGFKAVDSPPPV
ncbi:hypothetical protein LEN26_002244 [Aphanomyces euteiches]|nr:hypothetical protein AeMF1_005958 [Aphanomyces euteiches]KAH9159627.1 hypothetical protein LEN26_002244 [Aphanomyces euteiches]KAH9180982.1 hypothetical protein AeNC1_017041 [Aphanomyces euteiches]